MTVIDDRPLPDARSRITRAGAKRLAQVRRLALRLTLLLGLSCLAAGSLDGNMAGSATGAAEHKDLRVFEPTPSARREASTTF